MCHRNEQPEGVQRLAMLIDQPTTTPIQGVNVTLTITCVMGVKKDPCVPVARGAIALTITRAGPTKLIGGVVTEVWFVIV